MIYFYALPDGLSAKLKQITSVRFERSLLLPRRVNMTQSLFKLN